MTRRPSGPTDAAALATARGRADAIRSAVMRFAGVLRLSRLHSHDNQALRAAVSDLCARLAPLLEMVDALRLTIDRDVLRVNGAVVTDLGRPSTAVELTALRDDYLAHGAGGLSLHRNIQPDDLLTFLAVWRHPRRGLSGEQLQLQLAEVGVRSVLVHLPEASSERSDAGNTTGAIGARDVLDAFAALVTVAEMLADPESPLDPATLGKVQASVEQIASFTDAVPDLVLFATTCRDVANYDAVHAANTATLSMLLARRLGLAHEATAELGRAALLCDIGMRALPRELRLDPGDLDAETTALLLEHPLRSFLLGFGTGPLDAARRAQLAVAWEHHAGLDGLGYPRAAPGRGPHLFARLVSICDAYDALVHDRGDRSGLARPLALEALFQEVDRRFDRQLLLAFFGMLGRFPPGSVVRVREGSIALVGCPSDDPRLFDRPELFLIRDPTGTPLPRPTRLDLGTQRGERASSVVEVLDDRLFEESLFQLVF